VGVVIVAIVGNAANIPPRSLRGTGATWTWRWDHLGVVEAESRSWSRPSWCFVGILLGVPMDLAFTRFEVVALGISVIALAPDRAGRGDELAGRSVPARGLRGARLGFFFVG